MSQTSVFLIGFLGQRKQGFIPLLKKTYKSTKDPALGEWHLSMKHLVEPNNPTKGEHLSMADLSQIFGVLVSNAFL
jgi:hypothetical protein